MIMYRFSPGSTVLLVNLSDEMKMHFVRFFEQNLEGKCSPMITVKYGTNLSGPYLNCKPDNILQMLLSNFFLLRRLYSDSDKVSGRMGAVTQWGHRESRFSEQRSQRYAEECLQIKLKLMPLSRMVESFVCEPLAILQTEVLQPEVAFDSFFA